jgi:hypothetical protein
MSNFETRAARAGMNPSEIQKFVGDFAAALVQMALVRVRDVDVAVERFENKFDGMASGLDWRDAGKLASVGIDIRWISNMPQPHRTFMHPDLIIYDPNWVFVRDYIAISMVSKKQSRVLMPNLAKARKPTTVSIQELMYEAKLLNYYLHLVQEAGLCGDRIMAYKGDLRTHGRSQNYSGKVGSVGAVAAVQDALAEISPGAVIDTYGTMPPDKDKSPNGIVDQMTSPGYTLPRSLLLSSQRAVILSSDPDIAIVSRIGGERYQSAKEAADEWAELKKGTGEERNARIHQAALGEVKTALDSANIHERLALGSRETSNEVRAPRFLLMAVLTPNILDPQRTGRRAINSREIERFQEIFNLYFAWGYDSARTDHPEHWNDFKTAIRRWTAL